MSHPKETVRCIGVQEPLTSEQLFSGNPLYITHGVFTTGLTKAFIPTNSQTAFLLPNILFLSGDTYVFHVFLLSLLLVCNCVQPLGILNFLWRPPCFCTIFDPGTQSEHATNTVDSCNTTKAEYGYDETEEEVEEEEEEL